MLAKRPTGCLLDFGQHVIVVVAGDDLTKCHPWREIKDLPAAHHLTDELVDESKSLPVRSCLAEPGNWMLHRGPWDHTAGDRDQDLQVRDSLHEDLEAAWPVVEFPVRMRHELGIGLDPAARKNEQCASLLEMADGGPYDMHPSCGIRFLRRVNGICTDMREVLKKRDIANDHLVIRPLHIRRDDDRIDTCRVVRSDHQWTAGWDRLHTPRLMRFNETR